MLRTTTDTSATPHPAHGETSHVIHSRNFIHRLASNSPQRYRKLALGTFNGPMSETEIQPAVSEAVIVADVVEEDHAEVPDHDRVGFDEPENDLEEDADRDHDDQDDDDPDYDDNGDDRDEYDEDEHDDDDEYDRGAVVLREVIQRQLIACRTLSTQVADAATDVTAILVESPARVIAAVRDGASLPSALGLTGDALADAALEAGGRIRAAVAGYVNSQSALPNALIAGTAEIAGSAVRAQGSLASSALDAAFTVAAVTARGEDLRDTFDEEWRGLVASVASVRDDVEDAIETARRNIVVTLPEGAVTS